MNIIKPMNKTDEMILRRRMHGLYLTRRCDDITDLSRELLGLHCWFHRNVVFSAIIRGANINGWKTRLTKTWLYRGTLHGVVYDELPTLLALHCEPTFAARQFGSELAKELTERIIRLMEDGVFSRSEMRKIFSMDYDDFVVRNALSPWGGIFVELARRGQVAFRDMVSRDFDLISAEPTQSAEAVLPGLLRRFFAAYGPATLADAGWFFGMWREGKKALAGLDLREYSRIERDKEVFYYIDDGEEPSEIPELTLLSGFDPLIVSFTASGRGAVLPQEYKSAVILKSGICLPTIAVNGRVAGLWNIKKNESVVEFFSEPTKEIRIAAAEKVDGIRRRASYC